MALLNYLPRKTPLFLECLEAWTSTLLWIKLATLGRISVFCSHGLLLCLAKISEPLLGAGDGSGCLLSLECHTCFMNMMLYWATSNLLELPLSPWNLYYTGGLGQRWSGSQYSGPGAPEVESLLTHKSDLGGRRKSPNLGCHPLEFSLCNSEWGVIENNLSKTPQPVSWI